MEMSSYIRVNESEEEKCSSGWAKCEEEGVGCTGSGREGVYRVGLQRLVNIIDNGNIKKKLSTNIF